MYEFDLVISDITTPEPYYADSIKQRAIGGTEATVIRVAEALAAQGLRVGVLVHNLQYELSGQNAFFLPISYANQIETRNYIALRSTWGFDLFPNANKYSWHQDVPNERLLKLVPDLQKHKAPIICVSKWHMEYTENLLRQNGVNDVDVLFRYNMCPDVIYLDKPLEYNRNKMCWLASPHKGLDNALQLFANIKKELPEMELYIFNPGYLHAKLLNTQGVVNLGAKPAPEIWKHVSESLCTFYPTTFLETFGCIAAESNAIRTPIITNNIGALQETVSSDIQKCNPEDFNEVKRRVLDWHANGRPDVQGQDRFKESVMVGKWIKLLK